MLVAVGLAAPAAAQAGHDAHAAHATPTAATPTAATTAAVPPDVRFMQDMIPHHAQALDMAELAEGRGARREVRLMAERIEVAQRDEVAWMRQWLADRGAAAPDAHAHHGSHAAMAGMATPAQMAALAAASGPDFDRLFLTLMIRHHQGALTMAAGLLAAPGGTAAPEVFRFVADVEADQSAEIDRMQTILSQIPLPR